VVWYWHQLKTPKMVLIDMKAKVVFSTDTRMEFPVSNYFKICSSNIKLI